MVDVICIGEILIDLVSSDIDLPLSECINFQKAPGGAPANVAVGLSKLGINSGFIGKVGADSFGDYLKEVLDKENVDTKHLFFKKDVRTTMAFIATKSSGFKDILFYRNPGADILLEPQDINEDYLASAKLLHCGSVSISHNPCRDATFNALKIAKKHKVPISYDPNYRPTIWESKREAKNLILKQMEYADVVENGTYIVPPWLRY